MEKLGHKIVNSDQPRLLVTTSEHHSLGDENVDHSRTHHFCTLQMASSRTPGGDWYEAPKHPRKEEKYEEISIFCVVKVLQRVHVDQMEEQTQERGQLS